MKRPEDVMAETERQELSRNKEILVDSLLRKESLKKLMEKAIAIFGCPIILTTSTYRVLFLENYGFEVNDPIWKVAEETGYCGADSVALFESEGITRRVLSGDAAFVLDKGLAGNIPRILQKVEVFGKVGAYIGIFQLERPFTEVDLYTCDILCSVLSVLFERNPETLQLNLTLKDSVFSDLLSGSITSATVLNDRIRASAWKPLPHFQCVLITPEKTSLGIDNADYLSDLFIREIPSSYIIRVPEGLLLLLNYDRNLPFPKHTRILENAAGHYALYMNISGPFDNLIRLKDYYGLCVKMHRTAKKMNLPERMTFFEDVAVPMLAEALDGRERASFMQNEFLILSAYDANHAADYCKTLLTYIECGCNITSAAASLFIHRNTLARRLARISEICGIDCSDGRKLVHFFISSEMARGLST